MQPSSLALRIEPSSQPLHCIVEGVTALQSRLAFVAYLFSSHFSWLLFGFLVNQTYDYYTRPTKDHFLFKALVYCAILITMIESVEESFIDHFLIVSGWGNSLVLSSPRDAASSLDNLQPIVASLPAAFVQGFFIWRIWTICMAVYGRAAKMLVAGICLFLVLTSLCSLVAALGSTVAVFLTQQTTVAAEFTIIFQLLWVAGSAAVDSVITICMMVILYHTRASAYSGELYDRLSRLLGLTIQTGFITSILAVLVIPLILRDTILYSIPLKLLGKSYMITLLTNLNTRSPHPTPGPIKAVERVVRKNPGGRMLSFLQSVVRTIRRDLTSGPNEARPVDAQTGQVSIHQTRVR